MKNLILILLLTFCSFTYSQAQVLLAYFQLNGGCNFYQSQLSYKQADQMMNYMGVFEEKKGILVFFKNKDGEDRYYGDYTRNPKELHTYFGGKGEPAISKGAFQPFPTAIQPEDGNWTISTAKPVTKDCLPGVEKEIEKIAMMKSGNKTFKKPFSPQELLPAGAQWVTLSVNNYRAVILPETGPSMLNTYDVTVLSPSKMNGTVNYTIRIPGQKTCQIRMNFDYLKK